MNTYLKLAFACLFLSVFLVSCTKEGPIGPAGPKGDPGADGGPGSGGSAEYKEFLFYDVTIPEGAGQWVMLEVPVSREEWENSFFHVYGKRGSAIWLQFPNTSSGINAYKTYASTMDPDITKVYILRTAGVGPETFSPVRVVVIPM